MINLRVLITGGTGTISSAIVKKSLQYGMEVYAITRGNHNFRNIEGVTYIIADLWNKDDVKNALPNLKFDVVVECLVYNVEQLKRSLLNFGLLCNQYIFISTSGVYKRNSGNVRICEADEKDVNGWEYARNKLACEQYLEQHYAEYGFTYTIIRPVVTYGDYRIPFPVVTRQPSWTFFQRMLDNKPILTCDNVKFSVIHSDDFSEAVIGLFHNSLAKNEDFHIADINGEIYWDDVVAEAAKILKVSPLVIHVPVEAYKLFFGDIYDELKWSKSKSRLVDDSKIKKAVPTFQQRIFLDEGMKSIIQAMHQEIVEQRQSLNNNWNLKCDTLIYYAYCKKLISAQELQYLQHYYSTLSVKDVKKLKQNMWKLIFKGKIKSNRIIRMIYNRRRY